MLELTRTAKPLPGLNLTALVDVVFLLMVFFMLTTSFVKSESMEIALPPRVAAKELTSGSPIVVVLAERGVMYLGRNRIPPVTLHGELAALLAKEPDRKILLMSSETNSVQDVVTVMDDIYAAGGRNVSLANWKAPE